MEDQTNDQPPAAYPIRPYTDWSGNAHQRWIDVGHAFGAHLIEYARDQELRGAVPDDASPECRRLAEEAAYRALASVMALFDGIYPMPLGAEHTAEYVLTMRVYGPDGQVVETVELAPGGDGLGLGFAGWADGNFGQRRWQAGQASE